MDLRAELDAYVPRTAAEAADLERARAVAGRDDPWSRAEPLHVTGSAVVVHPPTGRVLLRWHERMEAWLHVGGHVDPEDRGALAAARREGHEETGLDDLVPWPDPDRPRLVHVAVVPVPEGNGEPAHEHADLRYVLATAQPGSVTPEHHAAPLRWLPVGEAIGAVGEDNLRETLARVARLLDGRD
jgi:8-oxo-dGTP pyrophosphatase MutT (NUDIX family)